MALIIVNIAGKPLYKSGSPIKYKNIIGYYFGNSGLATAYFVWDQKRNPIFLLQNAK
jgi:hypothetical protein